MGMWWNTIPMSMLCHMTQLTLKVGRLPGGPDWIIWALKNKSRELSPGGAEREIGDIWSMERICCTVAGLKWGGNDFCQ